ncbi:MAG: PorV/PorQ family protein [Elusimicrobia bacterium]|nr:PorV/PorQ family protein [Elusimicrobiota bacterium]
MRALISVTAVLVLLSAPAYPAGPGTSAAAFLNLGFGARPLAVGESFVALADDVSAVHYNPAGLAFAPGQASRQEARRYEMLASHALHIQDIRLSQFGFLARPWGFSATHLGLDGIERRTSETAQPEGTFGASDLMLGVSYGKRLPMGLGLGMSGKYIRQTIGEYSATAYAADVGALYRLRSYPVSVGASIVNFGTKVTFIEQGYPLPLALRLGAAYGMTAKFPHALTAQVDLPRDNEPSFRLGLEYLGFGPFALRAGYKTTSASQRSAALGKALGSQAPGLAEFYGMFMGVGFRSKFGNMDYTLLPYGELGNAHRFSFTLRFGGHEGGKMLGVMQ